MASVSSRTERKESRRMAWRDDAEEERRSSRRCGTSRWTALATPVTRAGKHDPPVHHPAQQPRLRRNDSAVSSARQTEVDAALVGQGTRHCWLAAPLQLQICNWVPFEVMELGSSRHLPDAGLTSCPLTACHC